LHHALTCNSFVFCLFPPSRRLSAGFADLHSASQWDLSFVDDEAKRSDYQDVLDSLRHCLDFLSACGVSSDDELRGVDMFTSHEGLLLDYESALTRQGSNGWYDMSAHLLWVGDRTRDLDGAHIEFFRGVRDFFFFFFFFFLWFC
jgi:3-deoxy-7-phosphoheptulonate synthase